MSESEENKKVWFAFAKSFHDFLTKLSKKEKLDKITIWNGNEKHHLRHRFFISPSATKRQRPIN